MDLSKEKREQLEQRMKARDERNESVLDSLGLSEFVENSPIGELVDIEGVTVADKPEPCADCKGTGQIQGLFRKFPCSTCYGTTFDLSNPIAIIKWQNACLAWAKKEVQQVRNELKVAGMSEEERTAKAIEVFYRDANRID